MRIWYRNPLRKATGLLRFFWLRLWRLRKLSAAGWGLIGRGCGFYIEGAGRATLKGRFSLSDHVMVYSQGQLEIGRNFFANRFASIVAHERISIGDNVSIGQFTTVLDHDHAVQKRENSDDIYLEGYHTAPVEIGDNVWIGNHCMVVRGVRIGNNVVVGAHTLVHKDVPDNCLIMGVPYKIIKKI